MTEHDALHWVDTLSTARLLKPVLAAAQLVAVWQQGHCCGDQQPRGRGIHDHIAHGRALLPLSCDGAAGASASQQASQQTESFKHACVLHSTA
jgi:hypothetical protein